MSAWETEDEYAAPAAAALPTPDDTPFRKVSTERVSSCSRAPSYRSSRSPGRNSNRDSADMANDENLSVLDPRRFTPTLHANLVAEILALRRDQEEKLKIIENLESSLHSSREEHETLESTYRNASKETRSLQRQLALVEGGTSSALTELARERDEAVENASQVQKRFEALQKKVRVQEEDSNRVHELWAAEKESWENDKRGYERKLHVAESRLQAILEEVAAYQASQPPGLENDIDEMPKDNGSDTASVRSMSMTGSVRYSMMSGINAYSPTKLTGTCLADELNLDTGDEETDHERESVISPRHMRTRSRDSILSRGHARNGSGDSFRRPGSVLKSRALNGSSGLLDRFQEDILEEGETTLHEIKPTFTYVHTGTQYTPPQSPTPSSEDDSFYDMSNPQELEKGSDPNGSKELQGGLVVKRLQDFEPAAQKLMISTSSQITSGPSSPPITPVSPGSPPPPPVIESPRVQTKSFGTQTEPASPPTPKRAAPPPPLPIPSISIEPPRSAPSSPRSPRLPLHSKDAACQVSMQAPMRSFGVQTECINVAERIKLLPKHLQPSTITSRPSTPEPSGQEPRGFTPVPENVSKDDHARETHDDGTTLSRQSTMNSESGLRGRSSFRKHPPRISSLVAGFQELSSDDGDEFADISDNEFRTRLTAPKSNWMSPRNTSSPVAEDVEPVDSPKNNARAPLMPPVSMKRDSRQGTRPAPIITTGIAKTGVMRRSTLISNGVAAHRKIGEGQPSNSQGPPIPIPTRGSSRQTGLSDGTVSPTSQSADTWNGQYPRRSHYRANSSIRKVRSGPAMRRDSTRGGRRNSRSRSPPTVSVSSGMPSSGMPDSPLGLLPLPINGITSPRYPSSEVESTRYYRSHRTQQSVTTTNTAITQDTGAAPSNSGHGTSVVDAIAQTMVGEWMWKYVRRRKSFGVPGQSDHEGDGATINGVRHRRWVWLAPYERAVMWSSKQPTTGTALMGKAGRKLTIQSVLDVKDDNPGPKGAGPLFNRSILILTPARALRFTASSQERHYVWLTALSFLAHSSQAVPQHLLHPLQTAPAQGPRIPAQEPRLPALSDFSQNRNHISPPFALLQSEPPPAPSTSMPKKRPIRDSIRVAKSKTSLSSQRKNYDAPIPVYYTSAAVNRANAQESRQFSSPRQSPELTEESPASPPVVPRFHDRGQSGAEHARKRSHTGPKSPPPLSFRGFADRKPSGPSVLSGPLSASSGGGYRESPSTGGLSVGTSGSSDFYMNGRPPSSGGMYGGALSASGRSSEASTRGETQYIQVQAASSATNNFFDAVGTMRMEAFIKPMGITRYEDWIPEEADEMCLDGANGGGSHQRRRSSRSRDGRGRRSRNRGIDYTYSGMNGPYSAGMHAGMIYGMNGPPTGGSTCSRRSSGQTEVSEWGPAKGNGVQGVNGIHCVSGGDAEEWTDVQALYAGRDDPFKGF